MDIRNALYDKGIKKELTPDIYTINVGNLTVGGTGKTPVVDYLICYLLTLPSVGINSLAILSRGYGRQMRGFQIANPTDTADTIGDEPLLLYRKHEARVVVSVAERRAEAIVHLLGQFPTLRMVILDDAFQHRSVRAGVNILLTDYHRPFYDDIPFPAGRLRERRRGAQRADIVLVTKCPAELSVAEQAAIQGKIRRYTWPETPIYFTGLRYGPLKGFISFAQLPDRTDKLLVVLVTGIAHSQLLKDYVGKRFSLVKHLAFPDHHRYTRTDVMKILKVLPPAGIVLTTEKDFVKLGPLLVEVGQTTAPFFYLPIEVVFLHEEDSFQKQLFQSLQDNTV